MNMNISNGQTPGIEKPKHPYVALMKGIPGVVALYLLDTSDRKYIPYVDVYAPDPSRLNIQPHHLIGKPYDWHGISAEAREPRAAAINRVLDGTCDALSYTYRYRDREREREPEWEFDCRVAQMPGDYLLIVVADAQSWQSGYWLSIECSQQLSVEDLISPEEDEIPWQ